MLYSLCLLLCFSSCEDVIEVETPTEDPRLVIDGLIRVDIDEPFIPVAIKVSLTDNFFGIIPVASLESISIFYELLEDGIVMSTGSSTLAEVDPGTGIYVPDPNFMNDQRIPTFILEGEVNFILILRHEGKRYLAQTKYVPSVPINSLQQGDDTLFSEEETEVIVNFTDDPDRDNFYVFDFDFNEFLVTEDTFYKGQLFQFSYFYDRQFVPGTVIDVSILGADESFYNYMDQIIDQSSDLQGPFQTPTATVRGNIFDITDLDNIDVFDNVEQPNVFPLGYFAIVQEYKQMLIIE